jgi:type II secretory pathway pseudopilin PulG
MTHLSIIKNKAVRDQRGFNLIEAAIVLGIVGLVVGGIFAAASATYDNLKAQDTSKGIVQIVQNLKSVYSNNPAAAVVNDDSLATAGIIPKDWNPVNTIAGARNPYGGTVAIAGPVNAVVITLTGFSQAQCGQFISRLSSSLNGSNITSIFGGGAGNAVTVFPTTTTLAAAACGAAVNNTVTVTANVLQ